MVVKRRVRDAVRQTHFVQSKFEPHVRQNVKVIVQAVPLKQRKKRSFGVATRDIFDRITSQNLRDSSRREGVSRAIARHGSGIHNIMPFEQLERISGGTSHIVWNRNEPEQVNVPRMRYVKPDDVGHIERPYLRDESTQMTTGRRPISLATTSRRLMESVRFGRRSVSSSEETTESGKIRIRRRPPVERVSSSEETSD